MHGIYKAIVIYHGTQYMYTHCITALLLHNRRGGSIR